MSKAREQAQRVHDLVDGVIAREGFELLDVEVVVERGRRIVRLYIDTVPPSTAASGIGVDDCAHVSRTVGDLLDVEDAIDDGYVLEVSSPGLFRPLTKPEHFDRALGERVKVKTFGKHEGRRVFTGTLVGRQGPQVTVEVDGTAYALDLADLAKANLEPLI